MSAIAWLVDRMHVMTPDAQVVREMVRRCRTRTGRWKMAKPKRKAIYRAALEAHRANRQLYRDVMSGRIN